MANAKEEAIRKLRMPSGASRPQTQGVTWGTHEETASPRSEVYEEKVIRHLPVLIADRLYEQTFGAGSPFWTQPSTVIDRRIVA